jgi:hypothetical protein
LSGVLDIGADYWPNPVGFMPELGIASYVAGTDCQMPGNTTFYGNLFDTPTDTITVSWGGPNFRGLDAFAGFLLDDVMVVRAPNNGRGPGPDECPRADVACPIRGRLAGLVGTVRRRRGYSSVRCLLSVSRAFNPSESSSGTPRRPDPNDARSLASIEQPRDMGRQFLLQVGFGQPSQTRKFPVR